MRDPIIAIALAGTSRQAQVNFTTGTPVDTLITELPKGEIERAFLLGAGAWAIYRQAGIQAQQLAETPIPPAGDESLRECSSSAALLVSRLLSGEQATLLPEALAQLHRKALRLPFRLLPQALGVSSKELRAAVFPLLGERGRWLSRFNQTWKWVNNYLAVDEDSLPVDAESIWQEGTLGQRVEILRRQRAVNPGKALVWLEGVWKQEKAEARSDLINTLEVNLSLADEPFLEQTLDDRSGGVRSVAATLLAQLPGAALRERMRQRGQSMLQMVDGRIKVEPPTKFVQEWQRDGITEKPPSHISKRAWWLFQILATIEPTFWETYLGAPPAELLNLLPVDNEWEVQVIEGWSKAARDTRAQNWLAPLWSWWYAHYQETAEKLSLIEHNYREQLLQLMPGPAAEQLMLDLIDKNNGNLSTAWLDLLAEIPQPWSAEFAKTYLRLFRENCTVEMMQEDTFNAYTHPGLANLPMIALALPGASFAEAVRPWDWEFFADAKWHIQYARKQIEAFIETVNIRQKIYEEIV